MDSLIEIERSLGYQFNQAELLEEALTHPSCNLKTPQGAAYSYQRLEFLGDSVLGMVVSMLLLKHFPHEPEGRLAQRKAVLVSGKQVSLIVRQLQLSKHIRFSDTEAKANGADNPSIQEDIGEAIIGAIYRDGGFEAAYEFVKKNWLGTLKTLEEAPKDAKTQLQEKVQAKSGTLPEYVLKQRSGESHAPIFTIEVKVEGQEPVSAQATTKRKAQQLAAAKMLDKLA